MLKNILYIVALIFLIVAVYFAYVWYQAEPNNREILPVVFSSFSSFLTVVLAWIGDFKNNSSDDSIVVTAIDNTDISAKG